MLALRVMGTVFGLAACAGLALGGAQAMAMTAQAQYVGAVFGLWAVAVVIGYVLVSATSGNSWVGRLAFGAFVGGALVTGVVVDQRWWWGYAPAVLLGIIVVVTSALWKEADQPLNRELQPSTRSAPMEGFQGHASPPTAAAQQISAIQ